MSKISAKLYRFRGYILGILALLLLFPKAQPFPKHLTDPEFFTTVASLLLFALGALVRIHARKYIGNHSRGKEHDAKTLETSGIYAYIRHPLYFSNTIIAFSAILFLPGISLWSIPFALSVILFETILSRMEDKFLEARFGDEWRHWAANTPALCPPFKKIFKKYRTFPKKLSESPPKHTFLQAFYADRSTWAWLLFYNFLSILKKSLI